MKVHRVVQKEETHAKETEERKELQGARGNVLTSRPKVVVQECMARGVSDSSAQYFKKREQW